MSDDGGEHRIVRAVHEGLAITANLPEEIHWLCDTIEGSGRIVAEHNTEARTRATMDCLMLYSFDNQAENQKWLNSNIGRQLARCSRCVEQFYAMRSKFYEELIPDIGQENHEMFVNHVRTEYDLPRVKPILDKIVQDLKQSQSVDVWYNNLKQRPEWNNAIYECICCPEMLQFDDQLKADFQAVCRTEKLEITRATAGLVSFLFADEPEFQKLAEKSWKSLDPKIITISVFEASLLRPLEAATRTAESQTSPSRLSQFFRGVATMLKHLEKEVILRCISGAAKDPIKLGVHRIQPNLQFWPALLSLFQVLMTKLQRDVWEVIVPLTPSGFGDMVFQDRHFGHLLRTTDQTTAGEEQLLELTGWMSAYIESIEPLLRPTIAPSLLRQTLQPNLPALSKGLCLKEGMKVLECTLKAVKPEVKSGTVLDLVRHANDLFIDNIKLVSGVAFSSTTFEDPLMEKHMKVAERAARDTFAAALSLNLEFIVTDFELLTRKKSPEKPMYATEIPPVLWDSICEGFPTTDEYFCKQILISMKVLLDVDRVYVSGRSDPLRDEKLHFNKLLAAVDPPLGRLLRGMGRCSMDVLESVLVGNVDTCEILVGLMMSRSEDTAMNAEDILLAGMRAIDKADAFRVMLVQSTPALLLPLSNIARRLQKSNSFGPMPRWIKISMIMLDSLCDKTEGVIRRRTLNDLMKTMLRCYWEIQWRCLGNIFKRSRKWAIDENKAEMVEFLRDSMDYAETLFDNFWTFEQALCGTNSAAVDSKGEAWTDRLLLDAFKSLNPFTTILSIQDEHLLQTCQKLMCKILGLLDQKLQGEKRAKLVDDGFFMNLKKFLHPETISGHDPSRPIPTNLTEVQKMELTVAAGKLYPDFAPAPKEKTVIELLSDDEFGDIPDEDMIQALEFKPADFVSRKTQQTKLQFPIQTGPPKPSAPKPKPGPLRVGPSKKEEADRKAFLEKRKAEKAALEAKKAAILAKKPKTEAAVSSSEDESSDDEGSNTLFKLGSRTKTVVKDANLPAPVHRKKPIKAPIIKRAKDKRARIAPDMSPLFKQIFQWDFFHQGVFPPNSGPEKYTSVAKTFKSFGAYKATFEPLLLLEAWQSFLKCKEEANMSGCLEVKISTRMKADNFVELETTVDNMDDRNRWFESDIVLLSTSKTPLQPDATTRQCIARVFTINRKFRGPREVTLRCDPGPQMLTKLTNGGTLWALKIMSLVPLEREYAALDRLQYYDLCSDILKGEPKVWAEATESEIQATQKAYDVNVPQAKAIISVTGPGTGFSLIQGPPGTGKTKTVVGIVGKMLTTSSGAMIQNPSGAAPRPGGNTKKLLVCAPSNAAVDELVIRFKQGVRSMNGEVIIPRIVRVGRSDAINAEVKDVTLEDLIDAKMGTVQDPNKVTNPVNIEELREKNSKATEERNAKQKLLDDCRAKKEDPGSLLVDIDQLSATIRSLRRELDSQREHKKENSRNAEILRRHVQQEIMNEAQIICATLSGSGHEMLRNVDVDFETVIIDEAAQSVELSALIPLKFGCDKCILVGDPQQLPPTVLSREAAKFSYEKSLFVRIQENHPQNIHLLSIQYRMHPEISAFPSKEFYEAQLQDGEGMAALRTKPWHASTIFGPYRFFDVAGRESKGGTSLINRDEVQAALQLFARLTADFHDVNFDGRVGIVTPYRQQLYELKRQFERRYGKQILDGVEFNTVDAFQGRERDIIIFSCVRAADVGGVGFLSDIRRMNVGLTRAKASLFVLGNSQFLMRNHMWKRLVEDAKTRNLFTTGNMQSLFNRSTRTGAAPFPMPAIRAPPVAPAVVQQVDEHWDPMDIDDEETTNVTPQNVSVPPRPNPPGPKVDVRDNSRPHQHQHQPRPPPYMVQQLNQSDRRSSSSSASAVTRPPPENLIRPTGQNPPPRDAQRPPKNKDKICHNCGQTGHIKSNCTKRPPHIEAHDPRIPVVRDTSVPQQIPQPQQRPPKRRSDFGDGPEPKRAHSATPMHSNAPSNSDGGSGGQGQQTTSLPPRPPPQALPPKGVIKRKTNSNPFIQRKPPPKPR